MLTSCQGAIDPTEFRRVLGHFASGVVAVTALTTDDRPVGMVASSFTSVSLEPPLVAFFPAKSSRTFPVVADRGSFCVNVLGQGQEEVCRRLAAKDEDKFRSLSWQRSPAGLPILAGSMAWIDCSVETIHEAGDHWIVIGRVHDLGAEGPAAPLLFFRGNYGKFASLAAIPG